MPQIVDNQNIIYPFVIQHPDNGATDKSGPTRDNYHASILLS